MTLHFDFFDTFKRRCRIRETEDCGGWVGNGTAATYAFCQVIIPQSRGNTAKKEEERILILDLNSILVAVAVGKGQWLRGGHEQSIHHMGMLLFECWKIDFNL